MTLRRYREETGLSLERFAKRTPLAKQTVSNAEAGRGVSYTTAIEILNALNQLRREEGQRELKLDDLQLNIV